MVNWDAGTKLKLKSVKEAVEIMYNLFGVNATNKDYIQMLKDIEDKIVTFKKIDYVNFKGNKLYYLSFEEDFNLVNKKDEFAPKSYYILTPEMFTEYEVEVNKNIPCLFGNDMFNI